MCHPKLLYPAYSKFFGLNEFYGLNGIAVTTRPNKTFNLFSPSIPSPYPIPPSYLAGYIL